MPQVRPWPVSFSFYHHLGIAEHCWASLSFAEHRWTLLDSWCSILRAFLIEEQKIVKKVAMVKAQQKKEEAKKAAKKTHKKSAKKTGKK